MGTDARQHELLLAERAVRLLARREHSRTELRRKLLRRRASASDFSNASAESEVDAVLDDFVRRGLLSDERFAEGFVRRGVDRGHGPLKIRAGLRTRGVAEETIDDALTFSDDFWLDCARRARAKRFGHGNSLGNSHGNSGVDGFGSKGASSNRAEWARHARFLAARGFASDIIYRTLGPQTV